MARGSRYPQEVRERAVRMVFEHQDEHASQWAAITSIAVKFGVSSETLRKWVRRAEVDRRPTRCPGGTRSTSANALPGDPRRAFLWPGCGQGYSARFERVRPQADTPTVLASTRES